jgi:hypothetical protein
MAPPDLLRRYAICETFCHSLIFFDNNVREVYPSGKAACGAGPGKVDYWEKRQHSRRECRENMARLMHTEILYLDPMQAGLRHEP